MRLQSEGGSGVTEFGLRILMGLLCPVRAASGVRSGLALARTYAGTQVTDWSPQHFSGHVLLR